MKNTARNPERGSAYIIALLALVVLTIIGMALSMVAQQEMVLGGNQRTLTKIFFEAQGGLGDSIARALFNDFRPKEMDLTYPGLAGASFTSHIQSSPFLPLLPTYCNLCDTHRSTGGKQIFYKINNAVTVTAQQLNQTTGEARAEKTVAEMVDLQPKEWITQAFTAEEIAQVRF